MGVDHSKGICYLYVIAPFCQSVEAWLLSMHDLGEYRPTEKLEKRYGFFFLMDLLTFKIFFLVTDLDVSIHCQKRKTDNYQLSFLKTQCDYQRIFHYLHFLLILFSNFHSIVPGSLDSFFLPLEFCTETQKHVIRYIISHIVFTKHVRY